MADSGRADAIGVTAAVMRDGGFTVFHAPDLYASPGQPSFRHHLRALVRGTPYDALHWFDIHAGVRDAALVAASERRAFVWTVTSGGVPEGYLGLNRVVVYTKEVAADARRRSPVGTVHGRLSQAGRRARFLHAGYIEDRAVAREIRSVVDEANASWSDPLASSVTDDVETGTRYAAAADVCIGSGRSAMEGIVLGRPTLVAWGSRYLGMVDADNLDAIAATNFQGRNSERVLSDDDVVDRMQHAVLSRLSDADAAARIHETCAQVVRARYSVDSAAEAYEQLYLDRAVTVDGPFRYYGNPRHLGREVFHRLPPGIRFSRPIDWLRRRRLWPGLQTTD